MTARVLMFIVSSVLWLAAGTAGAAGFPDRPVKLVVAYPAGGAVDAIGRELATSLSGVWGQPVVVENRPGATGSVGAQAVLSAPPDGYTLLLTASAPVALVPALAAKPPHDFLSEFVPITTVATWDLILVVQPSLPVNDVKGLIALAKSSGNQLTYASAGNGAVNHIAGAVFAKMSGADMVHIPYKGDGPAVTDLLAGRVTMSFLSSQVALPQIKAGRLKALAIAGPSRLPVLPEVPTMVEAGVKDFEFSAWTGLFGPASMPAPIVQDVQVAVARAMNRDDVRNRLLETGSLVQTSTSGLFAQRIRREIAKWRSFVQLTGIKAD
jgi:tripartite-type tricarboxylate transporter receptor subunit TctC